MLCARILQSVSLTIAKSHFDRTLSPNFRLIAEERKTQQALTQAQDNLRIADERLLALDGVMKVFSSSELRSVQGGQEIREQCGARGSRASE